MKRSRSHALACLTCVALTLVGCHGRPTSPGPEGIAGGMSGAAEIHVTNTTATDVRVIVDGAGDRLTLGAVAGGSAERFELRDRGVLDGGLARFGIGPEHSGDVEWSELIWVMPGSMLDLTFTDAGVIYLAAPAEPEECGDLEGVCPVR